MLVLLDTDHLSILQMRQQPFCTTLEEKLSKHPSDEIAASIVSFQENVQGWLAWINRAKTDSEIVQGYLRLGSILLDYCRARLFPFDAAAQAQFKSLRKQHPRIPTLDLRIASIALVHQAVLLTRNRRDFVAISGLMVDDWTR